MHSLRSISQFLDFSFLRSCLLLPLLILLLQLLLLLRSIVVRKILQKSTRICCFSLLGQSNPTISPNGDSGENKSRELSLCNTMKELFKPKIPGQVGMYVCGVTAYDLSHIGHARMYVSVDVLFSDAFLPTTDLHCSITRTFSAPSNGGRMSACFAVDVQKASSDSTKLGLEVVSKEVMEADGRVMVGTYARTPVVFSSGKGCKLYDVEGREYLDLTSGIAVNALGHGDPDWIRAVTDQANTLTHVSNIFYTVPQVELAKRLIASSFANRVFFSNSGTEANEAAIKFARKFQRFSHPDRKHPPTDFISFSNCFHGRTMGALALTSKEHYRSPFEPVMPGVTFLEYGNIQATTELIRSGNIAAVFVEPIQGEGGIYSATKEFLMSLRTACDDAGALLVFDEVQCGLGRTGYLWAHEDYGVFPDIMTLAKPLAGGLPIGAVLVTERVAAAINYGDHGSTFAGAPLVCSAAIVVLDKISEPSFLASVSKKGEYFKELLLQKLGGNSHVREVRGLGLIIGIELDVPASPLVDACLRSGLLILTAGKGNVVRLVPPLIISEQELDRAAEILLECLPVLD